MASSLTRKATARLFPDIKQQRNTDKVADDLSCADINDASTAL
jgi:hypothetical protein